ncbi:hypothetical protein [Paenibacillus sp. sgz500992]|uniref:hypothetical protein n=1 Tax=Paenibacillus sp. sgz500992 TaxID=3242476 RepID=UPI0036D42228
MERFYTGGTEYVLDFSIRKGQYQICEILDDETCDFNVVYSGNYADCQKHAADIKARNADFDYDL